MNDLDSLDPELRDLFERERGAYPEDIAARDAVLRRIQTAILLAPIAAGTAAAAASTAAAAGQTGAAKAAAGTKFGWKGVAIITLVAFGGGFGAAEARRALTRSTATDRSQPATTPPTAVLPSSSASTIPESEPGVSVSSLPATHLPPPAGSPAASAANAPTPPAAASAIDVAAERALIDTARTALARGLAADALSATDSHAKRFPHGRLAEEREAIAVQALSAKGDKVAARARAERFRRTFPNSIFRAAVDDAVAGFEEKKTVP